MFEALFPSSSSFASWYNISCTRPTIVCELLLSSIFPFDLSPELLEPFLNVRMGKQLVLDESLGWFETEN